jgi:DNA replication protein DnaD
MSITKKFSELANKHIYNLHNGQLLLTALEDLIYRFVEELNKKDKLNAKDAEQIYKLYTALATREKNINESVQQLFKLILEINKAELSDFQIQELQNILQKFDTVNIYVDKGELTDPKKFTAERSQILDNLDNESITD